MQRKHTHVPHRQEFFADYGGSTTGFNSKSFSTQSTLCETARRSEDRLQNHPAIRDERQEEAQHAAQDRGRDLAVLDVHPDEHEALDRQTVAARIVSGGCQWNAAGTMSPTVDTSSRMPRVILLLAFL